MHNNFGMFYVSDAFLSEKLIKFEVILNLFY